MDALNISTWVSHNFYEYNSRAGQAFLYSSSTRLSQASFFFSLPARKLWPISRLDIISWRGQRLRAGRKLNNPRRLRDEYRRTGSRLPDPLSRLVELLVKLLQPFFSEASWSRIAILGVCARGGGAAGWKLTPIGCVCMKERERQREERFLYFIRPFMVIAF